MNKPLVLEKSSSGTTTVTLESKHLAERRIFIRGEIDADSAMDFLEQIMYLNAEDDTKPISVFINSPGGEIDNGLLIYDAIVGSKAPVHTYCTGCAYSMGAVLFVCGKQRRMLPHSKLMLHEPLLGGKIGGNASSIKSISESLLSTKNMMNELLARHTGKQLEEINQITSFDHYFTAEEAVEWGMCDGIENFKEMMEGC